MGLHHVISVVSMFFVAQFVHGWMRANEAVNAKWNGITSYDQYFRLRGSEIAGRVPLVSCIFGGWASGGIYVIVGIFAPQTGSALASHQIAVTLWTAGLMGYFGDDILYFFIGLIARVLPSVRQDVPPTINTVIQKDTTMNIDANAPITPAPAPPK